MLNNSLRWDRKNILHYIHDTEQVKRQVESLLADVSDATSGAATSDTGFRLPHLVRMLEIIFKMDKVDAGSRKVFWRLKEDLLRDEGEGTVEEGGRKGGATPRH